MALPLTTTCTLAEQFATAHLDCLLAIHSALRELDVPDSELSTETERVIRAAQKIIGRKALELGRVEGNA